MVLISYYKSTSISLNVFSIFATIFVNLMLHWVLHVLISFYILFQKNGDIDKSG
jgi:hypothetical protein